MRRRRIPGPTKPRPGSAPGRRLLRNPRWRERDRPEPERHPPTGLVAARRMATDLWLSQELRSLLRCDPAIRAHPQDRSERQRAAGSVCKTRLYCAAAASSRPARWCSRAWSSHASRRFATTYLPVLRGNAPFGIHPNLVRFRAVSDYPDFRMSQSRATFKRIELHLRVLQEGQLRVSPGGMIARNSPAV